MEAGPKAPSAGPTTSASSPTDKRPDRDDERLVYAEVCRALHQIDDFRARLLALLPISSGAGILLLLETSGREHFTAIGVVGAVTSFGLGLYELRQSVVCRHLMREGARLEVAMGFDEGQFLKRPRPSGLRDSGERWWWHSLWPSMPMASLVVYGSVIAGWILLTLV